MEMLQNLNVLIKKKELIWWSEWEYECQNRGVKERRMSVQEGDETIAVSVWVTWREFKELNRKERTC